jgi:hypothetical protein
MDEIQRGGNSVSKASKLSIHEIRRCIRIEQLIIRKVGRYARSITSFKELDDGSGGFALVNAWVFSPVWVPLGRRCFAMMARIYDGVAPVEAAR